MKKRDMVIIGGGAGGQVVASVAEQLGLKVTLIERAAKLDGDCLHYPPKFLPTRRWPKSIVVW